jgi:cyclopropane fatty-acyl-phospholipid synthase-like methyltransferase
MHVLDLGSAMGFFTIPMAKMVGEGGLATAVDVQRKMLDALAKKARQEGVAARVRTVLSDSDGFKLPATVDFALAFWMAHEVRGLPSFFDQVRSAVAPGGKLLVAEPKLHVSRDAFSQIVGAAVVAGFRISEKPSIPLSMAALFGAS